MDDMQCCPICGGKLQNKRSKNIFFNFLNKKSTYTSKTCVDGHAHYLNFLVDENTKQIDWMKVSLPKPSLRFIEINYVLKVCRIACVKDGKSEYINLNKLLVPDFPNLTKLSEDVAIFVIFS